MDLTKRENGESSTDRFLDLIADPFQAQVQQNSIYAAVIYSFVVSGLLVVVFCFLRPRNSRIYAPRAKHADEKHRPIPLGKKPFSWLTAVKDVKESDLVETVGLDAVVFLRFMRMLRNIFLVLTIIGCGILIPTNVVGGSPFYKQWSSVPTLMKFTPQYIFGTKFWAFVIVAYLFQFTVCFFLWWNYRAVLKLRRTYFNTQEYKASLHSRTLLLTHIPNASRTDAGLVELVEKAKPTHDMPRAAIGRNVKDLPKLIKTHDEAVRELEKHLAEYLRNPNQLPAKRPTCKAAKEDGKHKVDAIDYLTDRVAQLETTIKEVRESVDMRNPMSYGFVSYAHIEDAHAVAHASRKKGPGCNVHLAPKPHDLLWQNLPMTRRTRRIRAFWDGLWIVLFTVAFVIPNLLTSVFLSDFSHLGLVWPKFNTNLQAHPTGWAVAQGILAPLVQTLMYMGVPIVFRRLFTHSGDISRTSRERHVTSRLYAFFVFNNLLVFSVFGSAWRFVAAVIAAHDQGVWHAIQDGHLFTKVMTGLCNVSTFWLTWQMQRNLGAAIDLSQAWIFLWTWIQRTFYSPTPRELIELSAPQPFPYADYYNNYLFVATVGMCMGALQPIILPVTAFYLAIDCVFKKYLLQYVFITKTESGGRFWRLLVNRMLFSVMFANAVIALVVGAQGVGSINSVQNGNMLYAMAPLPFLLFGFKWYCKRAFDDKLLYYSTIPYSDLEGSHSVDHPKERKSNRVGVRYGHPALFKKLLTPMVHAKSQHLLKEIYGHRSNTDRNIFEAPHRRSTDRARPATLSYGDMYLTDMSHDQPGKQTQGGDIPNIELVAESDLDFENFKKRAEFREQFGGDGELYGRPDDFSSRPGTPSTFTTLTDMNSPYRHRDSAGSRVSSRTRLGDMEEPEQGTSYPQGYQRTPRADDGFQPMGAAVSNEGLQTTSSRQPLVSGDNRDEDTSYEQFRYRG
ncbi:DUF221-domain-containing protein [Cucurbitaria berberidis CBS 394.84]|uniref:DUF221-domain-containing protein n=1 Tax=Cucurbitaria berberidis CBS 394.84 TaxID=1168544 RepID=A0A9P4L511_9PLEO|nr:DUF221-domain-containing protein [Cucurbitaria berberidis CBS 394.84]KAF1841867.1 DUF221-domain-containing protein [Cucurbitaria berberidis CBS 394.84]